MSTDNLPAEVRALYPFASRQRETPAGARQHYIDEGAGRPVLMLHGNPTWSFFYRELVKALRPTHRCIAPDHLGMGLSEAPPPEKFGYTLAAHIDTAEGLVRALGLAEFDLVVHDWGGAIGMGLAERMPARVGRIVVMNTAAFRSPRIPFRIRVCRWPVLGAFLTRSLNGFVRAALRMTTVKPMSPAVRKGYVLPYRAAARRRTVHRFVRDIPLDDRHPAMPVLRGIEDALPRLADKPMLVAWGGRDWCFDDTFYKEWLRRFPRAESLHVAQAGHYLLEDAGDEIIPAIGRFLATHGSSDTGTDKPESD